MKLELLATGIGMLGVAANVIIYQQRTGRNLLICKLLSDILWAIHYLFLGGYSGFAVACVGIIRESVFLNQKHKWAQGKRWLIVFIALSVVSAFFTWKSPMNMLPAIASVLSVFGFWRNNPTLSKILAFPISFCMLSYDIYILSYMGIANEAFTLISAIISVIILLRTKNRIKKSCFEAIKSRKDYGEWKNY
ncbi:MAG: YgjV family protein [Ruminococcaceae bacterium]|nr:YgjV family protein [Oscillospiraceae bacterium]